MDQSEIKGKSKKRKYVVDSVEPISVKKMLAHPALVAFRTTPPSLESSVAELEREPFEEGDRAGRKYTSQFMLTSADGMVYQGVNKLCQNSSDDICLIGLANVHTGKMKLIEAEEFLVSPKIESLPSAHVESIAGSNATLLFGTKKSRLRQRILMEEKDRRAAETMGAVEKALPFVDQKKFENTSSAPAVDNSYFLPPINVQAQTVDEVYQLSDVVEDHVLEPLIDEAKALLENTGIDTERVRPLFLTCLAGARLEAEDDNRLRFACAAIFVEYLCRMVSRLDLPKKSMDETVLQHLTDCYKMPKSQKTMSHEMRDKALAHLIVISLILNKYQVSVDAITNSVAVNKFKVMAMVQLLRLKKKGTNVVLELPLPPATIRDAQKISVLHKKKK